MSKQQVSDNHLQIPSNTSLALSNDNEQKKEKSVKSNKSPVSMLSVVNARSSTGMFNFDEGQGLANMQKKKEKLQQLCMIMNNRKKQIVQKEQQLAFQISRKEELINTTKKLQEQKRTFNISDNQISAESKQIERIINENRQKQLQLGQSIEAITAQLKLKKSQQEQEVGILIKQTSEINNDVSMIEKQITIAHKEVAEKSIKSNESSQHKAKIEQTISKIQLFIAQKQKVLHSIQSKHTQDKNNSKSQEQNLKHQLQNLITAKSLLQSRAKNNEQQKLQQIDILNKTQHELTNSYQNQLKQLNENISKIVIPTNEIQNVQTSQKQQNQLTSVIQELETKSGAINKQEVENKLKQIQDEHKKIINLTQNVKQQTTEAEKASEGIHVYSEKISKLQEQITSLSEETSKVAKKKEEAASVLIAEKTKQQTAYKDSEYNKLHNTLDSLKRRLVQEKNEYRKLEALNKQFVTSSIIEDYKNRNQQYELQITTLTNQKSQRQSYIKEAQQLKAEKQKIEWSQNTVASGIQVSLNNLRNKIEQMSKNNKQGHKKLTQTESKVKQYKEYYPQFEIKGQKKVTKKKTKADEIIVEPVKVAVKQNKSIKQVKDSKDIKETKDTKQNKKSKKKVQKKQEIKNQQSEEISQAVVEQVQQQIVVEVEKPKVLSTPISPTKSKKSKKKPSEVDEEQMLMNKILNSIQQENKQQVTKTVNSTKAKKDNKKKDKNSNKNKKQQTSGKSKMQQQLQFLMQSTKEQTPTSFNFKSTPIVAGLFVLLTGSAYWLLS